MTGKKHCSLAEAIIDGGKNVAITPCAGPLNYSYVDTWNSYAQGKGQWVKFIHDLTATDHNYITIHVGMPTTSSGHGGKGDDKGEGVSK